MTVSKVSIALRSPHAPRVRILTFVVVLCSCFFLSCGESQHCWCRCPSGSLLEFSEVSSSPPTCEELCSRHDCFFEGCSPGESQFCECSDELAGIQTCSDDNEWSDCSNCAAPPECLEGQRTACVCATGEAAWQHCEAGSWGPCVGCSTDCTPGLDRQCACEGGLNGTQTCGPDGLWMDCTDCTEPSVCEAGQEDICACENDNTGVQHCEAGNWGACTLCESALIHADIDFGTEGITVGGSYHDVFDSGEWGCPPMDPDDDSLIWRVLINDGSNPETIWFDFDLPATVGSLDVTFWEMPIIGASGSSEMEVYVNGTDASNDLTPHDGCVDVTDALFPAELFLAGSTNRIEVWSADNGREQFHGLQGIWISYAF